MTITLDHIVPVPIKEKVLARPSDVWNQMLVLQAGEWVKVKAPSGTGKTTLVHIIWQLRKDYEGRVKYNNELADRLQPEPMAQFRQTKLSVVFQDLRLFGQLTARENIELKRLMNEKADYPSSAIDDMAAQLGVTHVLNQRASTCSYGEQQRLAIIRALMQPFEWLIMDEPFSHLDKVNTAKAAHLIADECKKRGAGFLLTDLDEDNHFSYTRHLNL